MKKLEEIRARKERYVVGLMSGTSVDGVDAALVKIAGFGEDTVITPVAFACLPFAPDIRSRIFTLFNEETSTVKDICHMNFLLGEIFADAAAEVAGRAGMSMEQIDLIGSHGQTIWHAPEPLADSGYVIRSTLQIGEGAVIAHRCGVTTVSDFRVMDMAAGGQGAPLVPYTEYLLYRSDTQCVALLNLGGIGNITVLPPGCRKEDVLAFDTGPGNMVMDYLVKRATNGALTYDKDGAIASRGRVSLPILRELLQDSYFAKEPPKSTGRELYGEEFSERLYRVCRDKGLSHEDMVATATAFTASSVALSLERFVKYPVDRLIAGGGGSYNLTLLDMLARDLPDVEVLTQERIGMSGEAKEAIAFAILANEAVFQSEGNLPSSTGASGSKVLGKISFS